MPVPTPRGWVELLIWIIVAAAIWWVLMLALGWIGAPYVAGQVVTVFFGVALLVVVIRALASLLGPTP